MRTLICPTMMLFAVLLTGTSLGADDSRAVRITVVGLGYTDDEQSQQMRSFFATSNKYLLDKLNATLQKKAETKPDDQ